MNSIQLRYQIALFGNFDEITPTVENIKFFIENFSDKGFIPSQFNELNLGVPNIPPTNASRLSLTSNDSSWNIMFGKERLDFILTNTNIGIYQMPTKDSFLSTFNEIYSKISTNYHPSENEINNERLKYLDERITPLFLSVIKYEDFEFGQRCESINLVEENLRINKIATQNWLNKLYLQYFAKDERVLLSLLRIINYLSKDLFYSTCQTIALSAISHRNDEIKEMGIRIFENWGSVESYSILKAIKVDSVWLQKFIDEVIHDLEKELCLY